MALYDKLGVKKHALTLIHPQFEAPLPPLQPAVFPPAIREPPPPALELFDLDECFATDHVSRLLTSVVFFVACSKAALLISSWICWLPLIMAGTQP